MKRFLLVLTATVLALTVVACGAPADTDSPSTPPAQSTQGSTEDATVSSAPTQDSTQDTTFSSAPTQDSTQDSSTEDSIPDTDDKPDDEIPVSQGLRFKLKEDGTYCVVGIGTCKDEILNIPVEHEGIAVTEIGDSAFKGCYWIDEIIIPDSVVKIGKSITHETKSNIKKIYIGKGVRELGENALSSSGYPDLYITDLEAYFKIAGNYWGNIYLNGELLTVLEVPSSVTEISDNAFSGSKCIKKIVLHDGVTSIGGSAFSNCEVLECVVIGKGITEIEKNAFYQSEKLSQIHIPDLATWLRLDLNSQIKGNLYIDGEMLTRVVIPDTVTVIGKNAFAYCTGITELVLHPGVREIKNNAFLCCNLKRIELNEGLTTIGRDAFTGNSAYTVILPSTVTSLDKQAFSLGKLVEVYNLSKFPGYDYFESNQVIVYHTSLSEESIVEYTEDGFVFASNKYSDGSGYNSLIDYWGEEKNLILPSTYKGEGYKIGIGAFNDNPSIKAITIPDGDIHIAQSAFSGCENLNMLSLGNGCYIKSPQTLHNLLTVIVNKGAYIEDVNVFKNCNKLIEVYNLTEGEDLSVYFQLAQVKHISLDEDSVLNVDENGYIFATIPEKGNYLVSYIGEGAELTLPSSYNGESYELFGYTFYERDDIKSITLPSCITSIPEYAFAYCRSLEEVTVSEGVTSIGQFAFYYCEGMEKLTLPSTLKSTDRDCFNSCYALKELYISDVKGWCEISFSSGGINNISNPLRYADNLYVNGIRANDNLVIPETVTTIKSGAFCYFEHLRGITLPSSLKEINANAFLGCSDLVRVDFTGDIKQWCEISYAEPLSSPLYYSQRLYIQGEELSGAVVIPEGTEKIPLYAFAYCDKITSVVMPNSVTTIGESAFRGCEMLTTLTLGQGVTKIEKDAFLKCKKLVELYNLSSLDIPIGAETDNYLGEYLKIIHTSTGESSIVDITEDGFIFAVVEGVPYLLGTINKNIIELTLPSSYKGGTYKINEDAFFEHTSLESVTFTGGITEIGTYAFGSCTSLSKVTLSEGIITVGEHAFSRASITEIAIPNSVLYIGNKAFYYCSKLESVTLGSGLKKIGESAFNECDIEKITLPYGLEEIGRNAFYNNKGMDAFFENATGWKVIRYDTDETYLTLDELSDAEANGKLLESTYRNYRWFR